MSTVNGHDIQSQAVPGETRPIYKLPYVTFQIRYKTGYSYVSHFIRAPTGNCQVSCVGNVSNILIGVNYVKEDFLAVVQEIYRMVDHVTNFLILLDVEDRYNVYIEQFFNVRIKTPYLSTNNSQMCLFLVKMLAMPVVV